MAFVFTTRLEQSLFFLNPKFQASRCFLRLYRLVCVRSGWKPRRLFFSRCSSYNICGGNTHNRIKIHIIYLIIHYRGDGAQSVRKLKSLDCVKTEIYYYSMRLRHQRRFDDATRLEKLFDSLTEHIGRYCKFCRSTGLGRGFVWYSLRLRHQRENLKKEQQKQIGSRDLFIFFSPKIS